MERVNNILGRTAQRRQQFSDQRSSQTVDAQGQEQGPQQQPVSRRHAPPSSPPLIEQTARLGQQAYRASQQPNQHMYSTRTRSSYGAGEPGAPPILDGRESRSHVPPTSSMRPQYHRQHPATNAPAVPSSYQQQLRPSQERQQSRPASNYHTEDYSHPATIQADVVTEWEEDEDSSADMRYGDWEKDGNYPLAVPESLSMPDVEPRTHATRNLRDLRMPITQVPVQPPAPQAYVQEVQRYRRATQPLNPQVIAGMSRERDVPQTQLSAPPAQHLPRSTRQVVPGEQVQYHKTVAMTPPMAPRSTCLKCKGAGYLRADVPFGHPNFGKPIACECKEAEKKEKRRQQLRDMSNLDAFRSNSFRTFNPRVPGVQEAYQVAGEYAQNPDGWLLLIGPNGCGKTHLAAAIANQSLEDGSVVLFATVPDLLDHLRAAFAPTATEMYDQLFSKMREAALLVLDDLGAQQSSPWANEKLFQLLNYRYNMGMPTVITANPKGLQGIDERIRSRLTDNSLVTTVTFDRARDYRPNHPRRD